LYSSFPAALVPPHAAAPQTYSQRKEFHKGLSVATLFVGGGSRSRMNTLPAPRPKSLINGIGLTL
jgi:hypothetical protein